MVQDLESRSVFDPQQEKYVLYPPKMKKIFLLEQKWNPDRIGSSLLFVLWFACNPTLNCEKLDVEVYKLYLLELFQLIKGAVQLTSNL